MYVNLETTFAATRAEQHVAHLRAMKLGPLLAEVERTPAAPTKDAGPRLTLIVTRFVHRIGSVRLKWARQATELRPSVGQ